MGATCRPIVNNWRLKRVKLAVLATDGAMVIAGGLHLNASEKREAIRDCKNQQQKVIDASITFGTGTVKSRNRRGRTRQRGVKSRG